LLIVAILKTHPILKMDFYVIFKNFFEQDFREHKLHHLAISTNCGGLAIGGLADVGKLPLSQEPFLERCSSSLQIAKHLRCLRW
jgi:hypothetical protein